MWTLPNVPEMLAYTAVSGPTFPDDLAQRVTPNDLDLVRCEFASEVLVGICELLY